MTTQAIHSGSATLPTSAGTTYHTLMGGNSGSWNATEANRRTVAPASGTLQNLRVSVTTAPGAGNSWAFTLRVNGSDTAVTCTISDTATSASDLTHTASVTAGQALVLSCVTSGSPSTTTCQMCIEWVPTTNDETILLGYGSHSDSANTQYSGVCGNLDATATESYAYFLMPCAGTVKNLYGLQSATLGTGKTRTLTVRKTSGGSTSDTTLTCQLNGASAANDTTHTFTVAAGDMISVSTVPSGTPSNRTIAIGVVFVPDTTGNFIVGTIAGGVSALATSGTTYLPVCGQEASGTEAAADTISSAYTTGAMYVFLTAAPGSGKTRTFKLRRNNTTDTTLSVAISDAATTGNATSAVAISANDLLAMSCTCASTSTAAAYSATSYVGTYSSDTPIAADSGSFALTGHDATLVVNTPISAASGSFALTGNAATFGLGGSTPITAASGSFALTGNDVTFGIGPAPMTGASGSFALTGNAATFSLAGETPITAAAGSFALTGNAATFNITTAYFVKPGGNDSLDGHTDATAWATVAKVNSVSFASDSTIYFARGGTWTTRLQPIASGTSGHPIIFAAYGSGAPPRITGTTRGLQVDTDYLTFQQLDFDGVYVSSTAQNVKLDYCLIHNGTTHGISVDASGEATAQNCTITGVTGYGFYVTGTLTARNCIVVGNAKTYRSLHASAKVNTGGTLDYDYCILDGTTGSGTFTDGGHNQINVVPKFGAYQVNDCYFSFSTDDTAVSDTYKADLVAALNPTTKITMFVNSKTPNASAAYSFFASSAAAGHEVANHTRHHVPLNATYMATLTTTNANPTITIDIAGKQIILSTTTPGNSVTVSWASGVKMYTDLKTAVVGKGWTFTGSTGMDGRDCDLANLQDSGGAQAVTSYQCDLHLQRYYADEITGCSDDLQAITGIWPNTLSYPYGYSNAAAYSYLQNNSFIGARQNGETSILYLTESYNVYGSDVEGISPVADGTEAGIRARARWFYNFARAFGLSAQWYSHSADNATVEQVVWFTDEIEKCGGQWVTCRELLTRIRNTHTTADGQTYTKTYGDAGNYRLSYGSPAYAAGTSLGLTSDILGNAVPATPSIGAYEGITGARLQQIVCSSSE